MKSDALPACGARTLWPMRACVVSAGLAVAVATGAQTVTPRTDSQWIVEPGGLVAENHSGAPMAACQPRRGDRVRVHTVPPQAGVGEVQIVEVTVLSGACVGTRGWIEPKRLGGLSSQP